MTDWATLPLAGLDFETTGVDVEQDRIVTAAVVYDLPGQRVDAWSLLVDPQVDIPEAATAIHGISTEKARQFGVDAPDAVAEVVDQLAVAWRDGLPVVGFNVAYDLTLLDRESRRWLDEPLVIGGPVLDPLVIDRRVDRYRKGPRNLAAVCAQYGVPADPGGGHDAVADASQAVRLLRAVLARPSFELDPATFTPAELSAKCGRWHAGWAFQFADYLRSQGRTDDLPDPAWPVRDMPDPALTRKDDRQ